MSVSQAASADNRNGLLKVAACGILTGILTPLFQPLIDKIAGTSGDIRIALLALPFAVLVSILVRRKSANPAWVMSLAAIITMVAFVCAVNAAIWTDGRIPIAPKPLRDIFAGFAGGFIGTTVMMLGIGLLPAGPRTGKAWLPMLVAGTLAGALLAVDNALNFDFFSVLYPVWQAAVGVALTMVMQQTQTP